MSSVNVELLSLLENRTAEATFWCCPACIAGGSQHLTFGKV